MLVASKYDELDEKIPMLVSLIRHYTKVLPISETPPVFEEIVECERCLMNFFNWDLMILIPTQFVKVFIANGILFDDEVDSTPELAKAISEKAMSILDNLVQSQY